MTGDYRHEAREALKRARTELASGDDARLRYAALELRMAIESLTDDRALAFKEDFPPEEYSTWQPRKVMAALLEIDPLADKAASIAFGSEDDPMVPPKKMVSLGTDTVFSMKQIKDSYDSLGNRLHVPSIKDRKAGKAGNLEELRTKSEAVANDVERVLQSPVWNAVFTVRTDIDCIKCNEKISKRAPEPGKTIAAGCPNCRASYDVTRPSEIGEIKWIARRQKVQCVNPECEAQSEFWADAIKPGAWWKCESCGTMNEIVLGVAAKLD